MKDTPDIEALFARAALPELPPAAKARILTAVADETRPVIPFFLKLAAAAAVILTVTLNTVAEHRSQPFTQACVNTVDNMSPSRNDPWENEFPDLNLRPLIAVRPAPTPTDWKKQAKELQTLLQ